MPMDQPKNLLPLYLCIGTPKVKCCLYIIPHEMRTNALEAIQQILTQWKYLGVLNNAQQDNVDRKHKLFNKINQRIELVSWKADSILQEARIIVTICWYAKSPIFLWYALTYLRNIDRCPLKAYHYKMKCMDNDTKHHIFISQRRGGIGVKVLHANTLALYCGILKCKLPTQIAYLHIPLVQALKRLCSPLYCGRKS